MIISHNINDDVGVGDSRTTDPNIMQTPSVHFKIKNQPIKSITKLIQLMKQNVYQVHS